MEPEKNLASFFVFCKKHATKHPPNTELVKGALGNAIGRNGVDNDLIFHSDRGCQYSSKGYQQL